MACPVPGLSLPHFTRRFFSSKPRSTSPPSMHFLHHEVNDKPVETMQTGVNNLSDANDENMAQGLESLVSHSESNQDVSHGIHMHGKNIFQIPWIHKLIPG